MARGMKVTAGITAVLTVIFAVLYYALQIGVFLSLAVTCGTVAYHLLMRLLVGTLFDVCMKNRADYTKRWYQVSCFEQKLYKKLKVKKWKGKMPTYDTDLFDPAVHSWDEIAQAMCQSELVHEVDIVLSFLPIVASIWFGDLAVFIITSVIAAIFDLLFVIMQRYNRPRVIRLIKR